VDLCTLESSRNRFDRPETVIALVLHRLMRARMRDRPVDNVASPERALSILRRVQTHRIVLAGKKALTGISTLDAEPAWRRARQSERRSRRVSAPLRS
jgi:hypothetical protein